MTDKLEKRVCLGQIGAANGIKGDVRVKPFTGEPAALGDYGNLEDESGKKRFEIVTLRGIKGGMLVVKFKGVDDRNAAEALNGTKLYVDRSALPALEDENDFYIEDLVGLKAISQEGENLGSIVQVYNFGAGDMLDIKPPRGPSFFVPFTAAAVPNIALASGSLTVDLEASGLLSDDDEVEPNNGE